MQLFLDLSLTILLAATLIFYCHRGLIRSLVGLVKTILSIVLTYTFGDAAACWLEGKFILPALTEFVKERMVALFAAGAENYNLSEVFTSMPRWLTDLLKNFHVNVEELQLQYANMTEGTSEQLNELALNIATPVSGLVSSIIGHVVVFLLAFALLTIAAYLLTKIADLPVIKTFDRTLGLVLGVLLALLYGSVYVVVIYTLFGWFEVRYATFDFGSGFEASWIFKYFYEFNLFKILFGI